MKHTVDAMGKQCPIPVVMTKKILDKAEQGDEILILVDNETAVNNLSRLAGSTGCSFVSRKTEGGYEINMTVKSDPAARSQAEPEIVCTPAVPQGDYTVAITSDKMGDGDPELGGILIKGFVYALTQLETPPSVMLFYNGGARLTAQDSPCIEDLKTITGAGNRDPDLRNLRELLRTEGTGSGNRNKYVYHSGKAHKSRKSDPSVNRETYRNNKSI